MGSTGSTQAPHVAAPPIPARVVVIPLAALLALGLAVVPHALAEPAASEETEAALSGAQARLEQAQADLQTIGEELEAADLALGETTAQANEVSARIDELGVEIAQSEADLDVARASLRTLVSGAYKSGGTSLLGVLLASDSFESFASNVYYLDKIAQSDQETIDEVVRLRDGLEARRTELEGQRASLEELLATQERQVAAVQAKHAEAEAYIAGLDDEVSELLARRQEEIEAAKEEERRLAAEAAARAAEEEAARQEAARQAAEAAAQAQSQQSGVTQQVRTGSEVSSGTRAAVIDYGLSLLGVPYVYGGTYPESGGTDCSGFTMWCFAQVGISIPRTTYGQLAACQAAGHFTTDLSQLQPGDIVFTNGGGHVAIYIGNGNCVHEPTPGDVCSIAPLTRWSNIVGCGWPA